MDAPLIVPVFIPHLGCPHLCAFCNQKILTLQKVGESGLKSIPTKQIDDAIQAYLPFKGNRSRVEVAFYGGNFLGLPKTEIARLLSYLKPYLNQGIIHGIRCSTRPDTITRGRLDLVRFRGLSLVELGVQSMDDDVLNRVGRGHTSQDTRTAVRRLQEEGIQVGAQLMVGLPGDTRAGAVESVRQVAGLGVDLARIYPVLVLGGSRLALWHDQGLYLPLTLDEAVGQVKEMVKVFETFDIPVTRMGLQASEMMEDRDQVIAGPWHPAFGHLVYSALMLDQVCEQVDAILPNQGSGVIEIAVNPRSESRLRGDKNMNMKRIAQLYPGIDFSLEFSREIHPKSVKVKARF